MEFSIPKELLLLPGDDDSYLVTAVDAAVSDESFVVKLDRIESRSLEVYLSLRCPL